MRSCPTIDALPSVLFPDARRTHELLVKARNLLDRHGWIRRRWRSSEGICVMTAIGMALGLDLSRVGYKALHHPRIAGDVYACCAALGFERVKEVTKWNDHTTHEELYRRLDAAIAQTAPSPLVDFELAWTEHELVPA